MQDLMKALDAAGVEYYHDTNRDTVEVDRNGLRIVAGEATTETGDAATGYDTAAYNGDVEVWQNWFPDAAAFVAYVTA